MSRIGSALRKYGLWGLLLVAVAAWAGTSYADFLKALGQRESSMNQYAVNPLGYAGLYQMGRPALQDAGYRNANGTWTGRDGVNNLADYLNNAQAQTNAVTSYQLRAQAFIQQNHLDAAIGSTIAGVTITASGLIAGAHLLGVGNLQKFIQHGIVTYDGNGVPITAYIQQFAGYGLPVAGTSYASVLGANPTPSVGNPAAPVYATTAPLVTAASLLGSATGYATAADGFFGATGYHMDEVRNFITLLAGALILLWFARTLLSSWLGFDTGRQTIHVLQSNAVQGAIVVMLLVYLIW